MSDYHIPVLLTETIDALAVEHGRRYVDGTAGGGGHTQEIVGRGGKVLAIDQDQDAIETLTARFAMVEAVTVVRGNFSDISAIAKAHEFDKVDGVLLDIGVSSHQIDKSGRGFSFLRDEHLDMRMDDRVTTSAYDLVNRATADELINVISMYGEEVKAQKIVEAIVQARSVKKIASSRELAEIISSVLGRGGKVHPATKTFQAIRIAVNDELGSLKKGLEGGLEVLRTGGRLAVISFHSLEDRVVKNIFRKWEIGHQVRIITRHVIVAGVEEITLNPRARSAKLRVVEKI